TLSDSNFGPFLKTQAQLITSPDVLSDALLDPKVARLPRIAQSLDPELELRQELDVKIVPDSHLILVKMTSTNPAESATIINAVVESYMKLAKVWTNKEMKTQFERLEEMKRKLKSEVERLDNELDKVVRQEGHAEDFLANKRSAT